MPSGEATHTNFIVFGLTRPGLEPTIYRTQCEHANQYNTDAVFRRGTHVQRPLQLEWQRPIYLISHWILTWFITPIYAWWFGWFMVLNATLNNISVISWRSVLLVEETGVPVQKPPTSRKSRQTFIKILSHNIVSGTPRHERGSNSQF